MAATRHSNTQRPRQAPLDDTLFFNGELYIPSFLVLCLACTLRVTLNALCGATVKGWVTRRQTMQRWSRALWLLRQAPTNVAVTGAGGMTESTALFSASAVSHPCVCDYGSTGNLDGGSKSTREGATLQYGTHDAMNGDRSVFDDTPFPQGTLPVPVVAEVISQSRGDAWRDSQRLVLPFHPAFMLASALKCFVMLTYVHYHFDDVPGGWERLCLCGSANLTAGLISPVLEYAASVVLPIAEDDGATNVVSSSADDVDKDAVFVVQLLFQASRIELDDLPTVFVQGSTFVIFAALVFPVLCTLCAYGAVLYIWLFASLFGVWMGLRWALCANAALTSAEVLDAASTSRAPTKLRAVLDSATDFAKVFLLKVVTLWMLQSSLQMMLLLGVSYLYPSESISKDIGYWPILRLTVHQQTRLSWTLDWQSMSTFQRVSFFSVLFL